MVGGLIRQQLQASSQMHNHPAKFVPNAQHIHKTLPGLKSPQIGKSYQIMLQALESKVGSEIFREGGGAGGAGADSVRAVRVEEPWEGRTKIWASICKLYPRPFQAALVPSDSVRFFPRLLSHGIGKAGKSQSRASRRIDMYASFESQAKGVRWLGFQTPECLIGQVRVTDFAR